MHRTIFHGNCGFMTTPTKTQNGHSNTTMWAVSQVIINGNLDLDESTGYSSGGYLSGGYLSNSVITRHIDSDTQHYTDWNKELGTFTVCLNALLKGIETLLNGKYVI